MEYKGFVELREELKRGDNTQLKVVFEDYSSYCIKQLSSKHSCSLEDAEDIYIDAILNLREKIISGEVKALTNLRGYLYTTCKNMFLVGLKKKQRTNRAFLELYRANEDDTLTIAPDEPATSYAERISSILQNALNTIPEKCQELLKSFYFEQLCLEDIAVKFNFASANVAKVSKSRCFRKLLDQVRIFEQQMKDDVIK